MTFGISLKVYVGVSKNRGTPKWMVYNGKPYEQMDDLGGFPPIFWKHPCQIMSGFPILKMLHVILVTRFSHPGSGVDPRYIDNRIFTQKKAFPF